MTLRRLQGFGLLISAIGLLVGYFGPAATWCHALVWIGTVLLILCIPAVHSAQADGSAGLAGLILIEIGAVMALLFQWSLLSGDTLALIGALASGIGALMVGWLTTRHKFFPAWAGWAFLLGALLNLLGGLVSLSLLDDVVAVLAVLLSVAALAGYGLRLYLERKA